MACACGIDIITNPNIKLYRLSRAIKEYNRFRPLIIYNIMLGLKRLSNACRPSRNKLNHTHVTANARPLMHSIRSIGLIWHLKSDSILMYYVMFVRWWLDSICEYHGMGQLYYVFESICVIRQKLLPVGLKLYCARVGGSRLNITP